ncbi:GNAT family N-acetyltransferase [Halobacillus trueperi]|uniref:GNAT family N-acetyltransferase n=1 Tax=Halobacillus trueperi TaxID=156205 RepID=UPI0037360964
MSVRRYQKGDEAQIQSLFSKTFHHERPLSEWEWKFKDNPKQEKPFILVYEENDQILGHISLWLTEAYFHGKRATIGLRVDTMVDPSARGKGIYRKLNEVLLEEAAAEGIDFIYGFPAPKAKELFIRYTNATHMTDMPRWVSIQKPFSLLASRISALRLFKPLDRVVGLIKNKPSSDHRYHIKKLSGCDQSFDDLAKETRHLSEALVIRDAAYLNWRYLDHPTNQYELHALYQNERLCGYAVTKEQKNSFRNGLLIDWLAVDEEAWNALLSEVIQILGDSDMIQSWALPHTNAAKAMKNHGFVHKDSPMPLVGKEITEGTSQMNDSNMWFITPGDVDSF